MFTLNNIDYTNELLNHLHISNDVVSCKIFPNLGASIQELSLNNIDIIDGIEISQEGLDSYKEKYQSALLFPFVGRVQNSLYCYNNETHQLTNNDPIYPNALHGLVYDKFFQVISVELSEKEARVQLEYNVDLPLKGFPFNFKLSISYIIGNEGLKLQSNIINTDKVSFPFGIGWHPYFKAEELNSNKITFISEEQYVCDEHLIPCKTKPFNERSTFEISAKSFDDTFILLKNEVNFESDNYMAQMKFSENHNNYLQIYTPDDRKSIAIEPSTCIPDAFNNKVGLMELHPEEIFQWLIKINFSIDV